ncbi:kinase-like protein [Chaetoceros tenuissimus]|uniref:Kinase-like protein n=1 Tax=Chaetoceros tenuissimus TaxID=426638 RepID=A0AAD3H505_9STRA|nr:kinase-like protein [Chaetoceros tenuissimus]
MGNENSSMTEDIDDVSSSSSSNNMREQHPQHSPQHIIPPEKANKIKQDMQRMKQNLNQKIIKSKDSVKENIQDMKQKSKQSVQRNKERAGRNLQEIKLKSKEGMQRLKADRERKQKARMQHQNDTEQHQIQGETVVRQNPFDDAGIQTDMQHMNISSSGRNDESAEQWEKAWNSDDDDDDNEEDEEDQKQPAQEKSSIPIAISTNEQTMMPSIASTIQPMTQVMRPQMDHAHSSTAAPMPVSSSSMHSTSLSTSSSSFASAASSLPSNEIQQSQQERNERATQIIAQKLDEQLQTGPDGIEWDTAQNQLSDKYEKPSIQMFLPLLRVLGKGSFGKVVLVQKQRGEEQNRLFAMKILKKTHLMRRGQIERTRTERKVLAVVDHPFIMKLHYAFQTPDELFLVLDYCAGGELFFHLSRYRRFREEWTRFYCAELLMALAHLHSKGIIYRDLKPENVLLDAEGHVKLGDFGLAKRGIRHPYRGATSMCGTPEYMAPEILQNLGHGFCADYWGLGMMTYEMMTGLPPWYTTDRNLLYQRLRSAPLQIPNSFSPQISSCIISLLQRDPRRRLGVRGPRSVMGHDFFRGLNFREVLYRQVKPPIRPTEGWRDSRLDTITSNFQNEFTDSNVHSVDIDQDADSGDEAEFEEELNENTFVGFTFDEDDVS